eukprot:103869-Chlamydomonas_euryale.AAC.1
MRVHQCSESQNPPARIPARPAVSAQVQYTRPAAQPHRPPSLPHQTKRIGARGARAPVHATARSRAGHTTHPTRACQSHYPSYACRSHHPYATA